MAKIPKPKAPLNSCYKEATLYSKLANQKVQCHTCQRECVIPNGMRGFCMTRLNLAGKLYSIIYGLLYYGVQIDPIEKKPLYHFHPGTCVASIGSFGCNFRCKQCLNWSSNWSGTESEIGKPLDWSRNLFAALATPKQVVESAIKTGCPGIAFTYNEPTIWVEFVHDTAVLAKKVGLYTVFVTNGYITKKGIDYLGSLIDAWSVDLKGWSDKSYIKQGNLNVSAKGVRASTLYARTQYNIHIEVDTLVIPGINDDLDEMTQLARWIANKLGKSTPWHLISFSPSLAPDFKFRRLPPTPQATIEKIAKIGRKEGLRFVYTR